MQKFVEESDLAAVAKKARLGAGKHEPKRHEILESSILGFSTLKKVPTNHSLSCAAE
jgi:hypothetical protein